MKLTARHKFNMILTTVAICAVALGLFAIFGYYIFMVNEINEAAHQPPTVSIDCREGRDETQQVHLLECVSHPLTPGIWSSYYKVNGRWELLGSIPFLAATGTAFFKRDIGREVLVTFQHEGGTVEEVFSIDARWLNQEFAGPTI